MAVALADSIASLAPETADSIVADSLATRGVTLTQGILLERPEVPEFRTLGDTGDGMSWLLVGLLLLMVVTALRYRKNSRFFSLMLHDATEVRERANAFDDTLRETTFVWLLNLLWCGAGGILLYAMIGFGGGNVDMGRLGICIGMAGAYTLFLTAAYYVVGNVFADSGKASLWVKGYLSLQALEAVALFPLALLALCVPPITGALVVVGAIVFVLAKLLFIYKGFCIFFTQIASWVLFLYYLCSLEIVPLILTYAATRYLSLAGAV